MSSSWTRENFCFTIFSTLHSPYRPTTSSLHNPIQSFRSKSSKMSLGSVNHMCLSHWNDIAAKLRGHSSNQNLDGNNLDLATVIAIARYASLPVDHVYRFIDMRVDMERPSTFRTAVSKRLPRAPTCFRRVLIEERSCMVS